MTDHICLASAPTPPPPAPPPLLYSSKLIIQASQRGVHILSLPHPLPPVPLTLPRGRTDPRPEQALTKHFLSASAPPCQHAHPRRSSNQPPPLPCCPFFFHLVQLH
ncbi:hypothetical protein CgunFtcFv8_003547 [Champsocephalus gunnari]|uniref:Uncharacterized protein n=1 Tax=Champsocephalus gunnari TaxID=52237 RepID=A0AAN8I5E7_CHAGU|nr:hypothetical protein CgunFtcFv8_003547 [Champsocephalus gunnari]